MTVPKPTTETFAFDGEYIVGQVGAGFRAFFAPVTGALHLVEAATRPKSYRQKVAEMRVQRTQARRKVLRARLARKPPPGRAVLGD